MTLQQLNYVITIAETGSLNKAAELLFVAQPSLTAALKSLESEIGITIFKRSGKGATLTNDGAEFLLYARQVCQQYDELRGRYGMSENRKKKFGVSTQHYSFAVKAFIEMVKEFDTTYYEFAIRETKTRDVIEDVHDLRSEIGILFMSDFNRKVLNKMLSNNDLEFHRLIDCRAYVYLWRNHPLAKNETITFEQLAPYPCLSFEQGENGSFPLAEEILTTNEYPRIIRTTDRATNLNLMVGLNAYTLCSGIISEELNTPEYVAVPFETDGDEKNVWMQIGYITRKNTLLSRMGTLYIKELRKYLSEQL